MSGRTYSRDGEPMPDDWFDASKYPRGKAKWATEQRVGRTVVGEYVVSTVWLFGIDHGWGDGPPIIFETMVFGGDHGEELRRYCTEEQAMRGHLEAVDRLRAGCSPFDADAVHDHCYGGDE